MIGYYLSNNNEICYSTKTQIFSPIKHTLCDGGVSCRIRSVRVRRSTSAWAPYGTYVALTSTGNNHASNPQNMHMGEDRKPLRFAFTEKEQMACLAS